MVLGIGKVCDGIADCWMSACWLLGKCHTFSGVLSTKEINFCMPFCVSQQAANMCSLMELHYHRLAGNGMKQLMVTLVTERSCPPAIGPTLGTRFALS